MDLDLAQVRAFVAAADHGHVGRAAVGLFMTQQAVSKRIARLENQLGTLFDRSPTGITLTPVGKRFLPAARHLLEVADHAAATARADRVPPLRVDVWGRLGPLENIVRSFAVDHSEAVVDISMRQNFHSALDAVTRNELDIAFGNVANLADPLPRDLASTLVMLIPSVGLIGESSDLANVDTIDVAALRRHGIAVPRQRSREEFGRFVAEYADAIGAPTFPEARATAMPGVVDHVASNPDVVTLVPVDWVRPEDSGYLTTPLDPVPLYPSYAVWRANTPHALVPALLRGAQAHGRSAYPHPGNYWLPAAARPSPQPV